MIKRQLRLPSHQCPKCKTKRAQLFVNEHILRSFPETSHVQFFEVKLQLFLVLSVHGSFYPVLARFIPDLYYRVPQKNGDFKEKW